MLIMDSCTVTSSVPSIGCINIEIKKAGYLSISPLVDPLHYIKYTTCRFQLLQTLHENGQWSKGWTNTRNKCKKSEYNPLDLFKDCNLRIAIRLIQHYQMNQLDMPYQNY
jgi:hypothetical protein